MLINYYKLTVKFLLGIIDIVIEEEKGVLMSEIRFNPNDNSKVIYERVMSKIQPGQGRKAADEMFEISLNSPSSNFDLILDEEEAWRVEGLLDQYNKKIIGIAEASGVYEDDEINDARLQLFREEVAMRDDTIRLLLDNIDLMRENVRLQKENWKLKAPGWFSSLHWLSLEDFDCYVFLTMHDGVAENRLTGAEVSDIMARSSYPILVQEGTYEDDAYFYEVYVDSPQLEEVPQPTVDDVVACGCCCETAGCFFDADAYEILEEEQVPHLEVDYVGDYYDVWLEGEYEEDFKIELRNILIALKIQVFTRGVREQRGIRPTIILCMGASHADILERLQVPINENQLSLTEIVHRLGIADTGLMTFMPETYFYDPGYTLRSNDKPPELWHFMWEVEDAL